MASFDLRKQTKKKKKNFKAVLIFIEEAEKF
jgi:hypothetical protein